MTEVFKWLDEKKALDEENYQTKSLSSLTACSWQRSVTNAKRRTQKQGMQVTHRQLHLLRNGEIRKRQILLPALLQSQPDALLPTTSTPPPPMCHTWCSLHSLDSSTIFQPPSHHTSGQKPQSNDKWWIVKRAFQAFFLLSNHIRNCRPPRTEGALQGLFSRRTAALAC